jgi:hypothetical protein
MTNFGFQLFAKTLLTLVACCLLPHSNVGAQGLPIAQQLPTGEETKRSPVTMTIELGEMEIAALRKSGLLRTNVPANFQGRVDAIEVKRAVSFKVDHYLLTNAIDKVRDSLSFTISESDLDRLDYQPIKAKVYYEGFSDVVLALDRDRKVKTNDTQPETRPTKNDSPKFFVRIDNKRGFTGFVKDLAELKLKTDFGKLTVRAKEIAGIRFNVDSIGGVAVELKSGETFLGKPDFDSIAMKCSWGIEELGLSDIESVTVDRRVRFFKTALPQGEWRLGVNSATENKNVIKSIGGIEVIN